MHAAFFIHKYTTPWSHSKKPTGLQSLGLETPINRVGLRCKWQLLGQSFTWKHLTLSVDIKQGLFQGSLGTRDARNCVRTSAESLRRIWTRLWLTSDQNRSEEPLMTVVSHLRKTFSDNSWSDWGLFRRWAGNMPTKSKHDNQKKT